jgi:hypothetical protein
MTQPTPEQVASADLWRSVCSDPAQRDAFAAMAKASASRRPVRDDFAWLKPRERAHLMTEPESLDGQMTFDELTARRPAVHAYPHDTEQAAADSVAALTGEIRKRVYRILQDHHVDGLTDDEGATVYRNRYPKSRHVDRLTFGRRRCELYQAGLVVKTNERRPTARGRSAIVWRAA